MLSTLHIENIAVIESADITFDRGFHALTGETGAGKSIVIDAISAVIGYRTSRDLVRSGAQQAYVSALFQDLKQLPWMTEAGINLDEGGSLLLERSVGADGKNVCRIQGRPVTVSQLRELGNQILSLHGQHDGQLLLDERSHLNYLDQFGNTTRLLGEYETAYHAYKALLTEQATLNLDEAEKARRIDSLRYQIDELEQAELKDGEAETLKERRKLLRNAEQLMDAVGEAYALLQGGEETDGALSMLDLAGRSLRGGVRLSEELGTLAEKAEELRYQALDLAELLRDMQDSLEMTDGELDTIEERLDLLAKLQKKYGATTAEMLTYLERAKAELESISLAEERRDKLEEFCAEALQQVECKAEALSSDRGRVKALLEEKIYVELTDLDMPKIRFFIEILPIPLGETGADQVRFFMSANVGEDLKPIHKIASGGELSRIMLALKNVLSESDSVSTMIFDEVDAGVSGRAAQKVAEKMSSLSKNRQVICVTHLPQLAAMADVHFSVEKDERNGRTFTNVEDLSRERRREELARLTGGNHISKTLLDSAEELLQAAEQHKKQA
jgi:DNA repair protein RecN